MAAQDDRAAALRTARVRLTHSDSFVLFTDCEGDRDVQVFGPGSAPLTETLDGAFSPALSGRRLVPMSVRALRAVVEAIDVGRMQDLPGAEREEMRAALRRAEEEA